MRNLILVAAGCLLTAALFVWLSVRRSTAEGLAAPSRDVGQVATPDRGEAALSDPAGANGRFAVGVPEPGSFPALLSNDPTYLYITAVESDGNRLDATVCVEDDSGGRLLGTTTPEASLEVSTVNVSFPARLIATSGAGAPLLGYVVLDRRPPTGFVEIELGSTCALGGSVVDSEGRSLPAGVRVIALDPLRRPSWLEDVLTGETPPFDGRWASSVTDGAGMFSLSGLLPGRTYGLHAAGAGFATNDEFDSRRYACGEETITLIASPLFAAIVRVGTERTDQLVREASTVVFGPVRVAQFPDGSFPLDIARTPAVAGTDIGEQARVAQAQGRRVLAFTASGDQDSLSMKAQVRVPFLPADWHEIEVPRLKDFLTDIAIDVPEPVDVLGSLEILALAKPGITDRLDPKTRIGQLRLRQNNGETVVVVVLAEPLLAGFSVPNLPVGVYEWSLRYSGGERLLPRKGDPVAYVEVADSGANLLLDLTWTGAAEFAIRDRDGVLVTGPLRVTISARTSVTDLDDEGRQMVTYGEVADIAWTRRPYIVPFVPPGEYYVSCTADFARRVNIRYNGPFEFDLGSVTPIELRATQ